MTRALRIAALISSGRHPVTGTPRACRGDAIALAFAQAFAPQNTSVFFVGSAHDPALDDYLALGAGHISVVPAYANHDAVSLLTAHLKDFDVIVTGIKSESGEGSGMIPYLIAQALDRPIVANVLSAARTENGLRMTQFLPQGKRRSIEVAGPAVVAVHPSAPFVVSYAHSRLQSGKKTVLRTIPRPSTGNSVDWQSEPRPRQPQPLIAIQNLSGHQRMQSCIQAPARSGHVVLDGTSVDKAQILFNYLREHRLIDL